ncbi:MAG: hypothetical protein QM831_42555 [Kofleriaceae bacterium]
MRRLVLLFGTASCLHGVPDDLEVRPEKPVRAKPLPVEAPVRYEQRYHGPLSLDGGNSDAGLSEAIRDERTRVLSASDVEADVAALRGLGLDARIAMRSMRADEFLSEIVTAVRPIGGCVRPFANESSCNTRGNISPPLPAAPIELERDGDIEVVTIRNFDLVEHVDLAQLTTAKAIVLDMHQARGGHVEWLLPWIQQLAGASWRLPLHSAITQHAEGVDAYRTRFLPDTTREIDEWQRFVDSSPRHPVTRNTTVPIEIVIGHDCEAACELVTRMLETYTDARVYGHPDVRGRLATDSPARLVLPRSKITIYYNATHYELEPAIVDATGPTAGWETKHLDPRAGLVDFAIAEALRRLSHHDVDCQTITPQPLPSLKPKIQHHRHCGAGQLSITTSLPPSALVRVMKQCGLPAGDTAGRHIEDTYLMMIPDFEEAAMSRFVQYPGIERVEEGCGRTFNF